MLPHRLIFPTAKAKGEKGGIKNFGVAMLKHFFKTPPLRISFLTCRTKRNNSLAFKTLCFNLR